MKIIEMPQEQKRPFWQLFTLQLLDELGVDYKKQSVGNVDIRLRPGHLPEITVEILPSMQGELKPILQTFRAASWKWEK
jgi:hypothetical protein